MNAFRQLTSRAVYQTRVARSAAAPARSFTTRAAFEELPTIPARPNSTSFLRIIAMSIIIPVTIYAGGEAARVSVEYLEDNDIWHPEEDDD
eukprot:m.6593 g.6593  ORF g.6593 m.6593 type:complete len:91 (+) comp5176_c0_seq1:208-480(+)